MADPRPRPGRKSLSPEGRMVERSISLLPRQWAWLTRQGRGNASAAVRAWVDAFMAAAGEEHGVPGAATGAGRTERVSRRGLFLTREEMAAVAAAAATERDRLLVRALAETGARLGEALALTPARLGPDCVVLPIEERRRYEEKTVYLNPRSPLLHDLRRYAVEHGLARDARFWPFTRQRGHTLVTRAAAGRRLPAQAGDAGRGADGGPHAGVAPPVPPRRGEGHAGGLRRRGLRARPARPPRPPGDAALRGPLRGRAAGEGRPAPDRARDVAMTGGAPGRSGEPTALTGQMRPAVRSGRQRRRAPPRSPCPRPQTEVLPAPAGHPAGAGGLT